MTHPLVVSVRPPWPDEIPRVRTAFPGLLGNSPLHPLLLVAEAGGLERIVGGAGHTDVTEGVAGFVFDAKSRALADGMATTLVRSVVASACTAGVNRLISSDLPAQDPRVALLEREGFVIRERSELWSTELDRARARIDRVHARMEATGRRIVAEPLAAAHVPEVRALLAAENLTTGREIVARAERGEIAPESTSSFVVRSGETLAGVILARPAGRDVIAIESIVVAPAWRRVPNLVLVALWRAWIQAAAQRDAVRFMFSLASEFTTARRMVQRTDSKLLGIRVRLDQFIPPLE